MRSRGKRVWVALGMALITALGVGISSAPALAAPPAHQICAQAGSGYCMNAWNGGPQVAVYQNGVANDAYQFQAINPCNSTPANRVTQTCPFAVGSGLNSALAGDTIVRIKDTRNGQCVGTNGSGLGTEGSCGNVNGQNAANGVWDVQRLTGQGGYWLINRYWSDHFGQQEAVTSPGVSGDLLDMYYGTITSASDWSQVDFT